MLVLRMVFTVLSLVLFIYGANWLLSLFICPLFLLSGLFITGFAFKSTRSAYVTITPGAVEAVHVDSILMQLLTHKEKVEIRIDNAKRQVRSR